MSATATAALKSPSHSHSHSKSHAHSHSHSRSSRPSTTPRAQPTAASVGQSLPPLLTPNPRSPHHLKDPKSPSPSYFGFVVGGDDSIPPDSNPGAHTRQNWTFPHSGAQGNVPTPRHVPVEANPDFEAFRRQSEHNHSFTLNNTVSTFSRPSQSRTNSNSSLTPGLASPFNRSTTDRSSNANGGSTTTGSRMEDVSFFDVPRQQSPTFINSKHSVADHQHARLSLPNSGLQTPPFNTSRQAPRSDTLPSSGEKDVLPMLSPARIADLLKRNADNVLILDLRVFQQYATSRIHGALNLCIPTTLLKRPAYNVQRLAETFASPRDQDTFAKWQQCSHIIVYDANSNLTKEAATPLNVLKKFTLEGWNGTGIVIKGGFLAFQRMVPQLVDSGPVQHGSGASAQPLSISAPGKDAVPVAGGCAMPTEQSAANPFFGNIRQNMDLLDGVGQMPIKKPVMSSETEHLVPAWLQKASAKSDEGKLVSDRFLNIEKSEQKRMQEALSAKVSYGTPRSETPNRIQVAGIEKGSKNRYNNIFPYDHSRVRLQNVPRGTCDYINANHVKAEFSNRRYIATQAPIPTTFNDFWRVVWEQDVRVIVMLTAQAEGGQVKSHVYWDAGEYGPLKLKKLSERQISLESKKYSSKTPPSSRPTLGARRSTAANIPGERKGEEAKSPTARSPSALVRHFTLSHSAYPFQPMREVTQVQYEDWPDFGAPASPGELLGLVEQVNKYVRGSASPSSVVGPDEAAPEGQRPILVHCSAGCGRTGTFCTIDSVIDMLKRQRLSHGDDASDDTKMDVDAGDWVDRDDVDLVAKTVADFRHQRLSMVQNLRQFVLCYESILQWLVVQDSDRQKRPGVGNQRRSFHG